MTTPNTHPKSEISDEALVSKMVLRAADDLSFSNAELADVLASSESSISRCRSGKKILTGSEKQLGVMFLKLFRSLDALVGPSSENKRQWLQSPNHHLMGIPKEMIKTIEGLSNVTRYLDAYRGRV